MTVNPSATPVTISLSLSTRPRLEYVLTAPNGDLSSHTPGETERRLSPLVAFVVLQIRSHICTDSKIMENVIQAISPIYPVLNDNIARPLRLAKDGSLPRMPASFCGVGASCKELITLPSRSWSFFVLLDARASMCTP